MEIKSPGEFSKFIDLCRKKGVESVKFGDFELKLRDEAPPSNYRKKIEAVSPADPIVENQYSEEDILNWSSAGIPEEQRAS